MTRTTNGKTTTEMKGEELQHRLEQPLHFGCRLCPDWTFDGPLKEGRALAAEHRNDAHPDLPVIRRKRRPSTPHIVLRPELTADEIAEIDLERRRRARETGVVLDDAQA